MKLVAAFIALQSALLANGYNMGGYMFGRPVIFGPGVTRGSCSTPGSCSGQQKESVDRAFADLANEVNAASRSRGQRSRRGEVKMNQESIRQQQEWFNRAFGLAAEVASGIASSPGEVKENKEALRQSQEWANRAFGIATDVASGLSSPRYEVNDGNEAFQVALDVPGVKLTDIEILLEDDDQVLTVRGQRELGKDGVSRTNKFSKSFSLDPAVDTEKITAQLNNGVLLVSAPKDQKKQEEKIKRIPVKQVFEDTTTAEDKDGSIPVEAKDDNPDMGTGETSPESPPGDEVE